MQLLLDENSPWLVQRLAEMSVYAQSVQHIGLAGHSDLEIWEFAMQNDFAVVTSNARDFVKQEIDPGKL